ncbi:17460_t:CDS:1 [Funneliformis geosporum]|uniref:15191_t:CDS:1 n=1 Tax=Funneliformis geosporum TaxID=1117311 RepID=A0A9W4WRL3_9GLOM|nr:15191_t:CDS:1 [Funneliformis geosporum]CAI2196545.1 17460_t:CDS:1 [Funneliformis geosporum]
MPKKVANLTYEQERKLLKIAKEGEGKAKINAIRLLVYYNQKIVKYIAKGYHSLKGKFEHDDLISEGVSSLPKAIEKFDMNVKYRFSTYAMYWVKQFFQTFINQNQVVKQSPKPENRKNIVFYDTNSQDDGDDKQSYSLEDSLNDNENSNLDLQQVHQRDVSIQVNNAINSLIDREEILLARLWYKIVPTNLLDIYHLATKEEQKVLKKMIKSSGKFTPELFRNYFLEQTKNSNLSVTKKYLKMFEKKHKASELVSLLDKSENAIRQMKKQIIKKLKKVVKERKLGSLVEGD